MCSDQINNALQHLKTLNNPDSNPSELMNSSTFLESLLSSPNFYVLGKALIVERDLSAKIYGFNLMRQIKIIYNHGDFESLLFDLSSIITNYAYHESALFDAISRYVTELIFCTFSNGYNIIPRLIELKGHVKDSKIYERLIYRVLSLMIDRIYQTHLSISIKELNSNILLLFENFLNFYVGNNVTVEEIQCLARYVEKTPLSLYKSQSRKLVILVDLLDDLTVTEPILDCLLALFDSKEKEANDVVCYLFKTCKDKEHLINFIEYSIRNEFHRYYFLLKKFAFFISQAVTAFCRTALATKEHIVSSKTNIVKNIIIIIKRLLFCRSKKVSIFAVEAFYKLANVKDNGNEWTNLLWKIGENLSLIEMFIYVYLTNGKLIACGMFWPENFQDFNKQWKKHDFLSCDEYKAFNDEFLTKFELLFQALRKNWPDQTRELVVFKSSNILHNISDDKLNYYIRKMLHKMATLTRIVILNGSFETDLEASRLGVFGLTSFLTTFFDFSTCSTCNTVTSIFRPCSHTEKFFLLSLPAFSILSIYSSTPYFNGELTDFLFNSVYVQIQKLCFCENLEGFITKNNVYFFCKSVYEFMISHKEHIFKLKLDQINALLQSLIAKVFELSDFALICTTTIIRSYFYVLKLHNEPPVLANIFNSYFRPILSQLFERFDLPSDFTIGGSSRVFAITFFGLDQIQNEERREFNRRIMVLIELVCSLLGVSNNYFLPEFDQTMFRLLKLCLDLICLLSSLWYSEALCLMPPHIRDKMISIDIAKTCVLLQNGYTKNDSDDAFYPRNCLHKLFNLVILIETKFESHPPIFLHFNDYFYENILPRISTMRFYDIGVFTKDLMIPLFLKYSKSLMTESFSEKVAYRYTGYIFHKINWKPLDLILGEFEDEGVYFDFLKNFLKFLNAVIFSTGINDPIEELDKLFGSKFSVSDIKTAEKNNSLSGIGQNFLLKHLDEVFTCLMSILSHVPTENYSLWMFCVNLADDVIKFAEFDKAGPRFMLDALNRLSFLHRNVPSGEHLLRVEKLCMKLLDRNGMKALGESLNSNIINDCIGYSSFSVHEKLNYIRALLVML